MMRLIKVRGYYYYNRRVPEEMREYDTRQNIRISLKTDSKSIALKRAVVFNEQVESYWHDLVKGKARHDNSRFSKTVKIARQLGFSYEPMSVVANLPILELVERILVLKEASLPQVEAVLGAKPAPTITVKEALKKYWELSKDKILNKPLDKVRKWENPRKRTIANFIKAVGNKELTTITREDMLVFRDWWLGRIDKDDMNPDTANKDFIHLKVIFETISDHLKLGLDIAHLFKKIKIKSRHKQTRLPLSTEQISTILHSSKLDLLNEQAKWFLFVAAETGARPSELTGLLPCDINLQDKIPHISIKDRKERELKTPHSEREIPLVGYALEAFKNLPNGFTRYRDKTDSLTGLLNKFLREHDLLPTENHSLYSFRHSFQDRLLAANAPDRVQAELMGHKFNRPKYGSGPTLEHKLEWMNKICIK
ncbi:MAG: tyrosine-type recombinase/integrase [Flavipsychrobacter sp.]|nr:tyrosine-type recombinase/integrase [Flavipsychrobacter sp.]